MVIFAVCFFFLIYAPVGAYGDQSHPQHSHGGIYPEVDHKTKRGEMPSLFFPSVAGEGTIDRNATDNSSVRIDGVLQRGNHWIVWINGYKVTQVLQHPQFEVLTVASDLVQLRHRPSGQVVALTPGVVAPLVRHIVKHHQTLKE